MKILEEFFPKTCLVNQDILGSQERWNKILKMMNDEGEQARKIEPSQHGVDNLHLPQTCEKIWTTIGVRAQK